MVQLIKTLFSFYINASIHVAFAVYAFVRVTELYFHLEYNEPLNYFIFYGTITAYNFVKYFGIAKFHHRSLTLNLKVIQLFSLGCFFLLCFYAVKLSFNELLLFGFFGLLTVLYAVPFLSGFQKNLRALSYLKIIIVAFVWAGVTVGIPVLTKKALTTEFVLVFIQRFLLVCALILPFDIRDLKFDAVALQTIPKKIGVTKTKKLGYLLLLISALLEFFISPNSHYKNIFILMFFIVLVFIMRARTNQSKYYSSFWVEAIPVFWWIALLLVDYYE